MNSIIITSAIGDNSAVFGQRKIRCKTFELGKPLRRLQRSLITIIVALNIWLLLGSLDQASHHSKTTDKTTRNAAKSQLLAAAQMHAYRSNDLRWAQYMTDNSHRDC